METPSIFPRYRLQIGEPARVTVILAGCGGTGSFAALHLARIAYEMKCNGGPALELGFVDPDHVEAKNIGRQNFVPGEIGQPKAVALASRYNLAFGLRIGASVKRIGEAGLIARWSTKLRHTGDMLLVIGCVDSPAARVEIAGEIEAVSRWGTRRDIWWLDAGNDEHSGQVLIGNSRKMEIDPALGCLSLPLPSVQEPGLISSQMSVISSQTDGLSCAELLALNVQSLMINQVMAGWLGVYASRLLLSKDLDIYQTWVDLRSGVARSVAVTGAAEVRVAEVTQADRVAAAQVAADGDPVGGECPQCGGALIEGQDVDREFTGDAEPQEIDIVFCPACGWQERLDEWEDRLQEMLDEEEQAEAEELGLVEEAV